MAFDRGQAFATVAGTATSGAAGLTVPLPSADLVLYRVAGANACGLGRL